MGVLFLPLNEILVHGRLSLDTDFVRMPSHREGGGTETEVNAEKGTARGMRRSETAPKKCRTREYKLQNRIN